MGCCVLRRTALQMNQSGALAPVYTFVLPGVRNGLWASTGAVCRLVHRPCLTASPWPRAVGQNEGMTGARL